MLPIIIDTTDQKLVLIGRGEAFRRRRALIEAAGGKNILINPENMDDISAGSLVFIAGLDPDESARKAAAARAAGALVNTHDMPLFCDFHMPAQMRRGDILFTVSTGGRSPALARMLREDLEKNYGSEWGNYLDILAAKRIEWRAQGMDFSARVRAAQKIVEEQGWIK